MGDIAVDIFKKVEQLPFIFVFTGVLATIMLVIFAFTSVANYDKQTKLKLMELCVESGSTFDDCKFSVYGGIRINFEDTTPAIESQN